MSSPALRGGWQTSTRSLFGSVCAVVRHAGRCSTCADRATADSGTARSGAASKRAENSDERPISGTSEVRKDDSITATGSVSTADVWLRSA